MTYEFRTLDNDTVEQLIGLSGKWQEEGCTYGLVANTREDLREPLVVAVEDGRIIGYVFGHFYAVERRTSYIEIGETCFSVDEFYVLPEYRSMGTGKKLFQLMEDHVKNQCAYITLSTSTKNYKAILKLYIEELGMSFHDAFLIKQMGEEA